MNKTSFYNSKIKSSEIAKIYNEGTSGEIDSNFKLIKADSNKETTQFTLSALIEPDYSAGSPESTILSKDKSFSLSLNNLIQPEKRIKFEAFDGISWSSIEGVNPVKEGEPTHIAVVINGAEISLYQNGILEATSILDKVITLTEKEIKMLSPTDITSNSKTDLIMKGGLYETIRGDSKVTNEFSGQIYDIAIYKRSI